MKRVLAYDRVIDTALDLLGAVRVSGDAGPAGLHVHVHPPARLSSDEPLYRRDGETVIFSPPGVGTFRIAPCDIAVTPGGGADVTDLLIATALPAWLWLRGRFVLHAAAVVLPGMTGAVAIAGASGSGKSSMLAQLLARGARVVADDTLAIDLVGGEPWGSGLAGGYFRRLGDSDRREFAAVPVASSVRRAAIGAMMVLTRGDGAPWFERLSPVAAMPLLLAERHRPAVPRLLGCEAAVLAHCAALAIIVPVYRWHRPAGLPALDDAEHALLARTLHLS